MTQQPFDVLAHNYDERFSHTRTGQYLRQRTHDRLLRYFRQGQTILEMGCGTGEDALFLAKQGIRVIATDASQAMLQAARHKTRGLTLVDVQPLDLNHLVPDHFADQQFDGAFANSGVLNCVQDRRHLAGWLHERLAPGAFMMFGIMSPFCLWEIIWYGLHGDSQVALRRFKSQVFQPAPDSLPVKIHYPTIRQITQDFSPCFRRITMRPLGLFLPPSEIFGVIEKRPWLFRSLASMETLMGNSPVLSMLADHYWIVFEHSG